VFLVWLLACSSICLNGDLKQLQELEGRSVRVNFANERPAGNRGGGGGFGGGGYGSGGGGYGGSYGGGNQSYSSGGGQDAF
jgi:hypothetical protein